MVKDKKNRDVHAAAATALTAPDAPADTVVETAPEAAAASVTPPARRSAPAPGAPARPAAEPSSSVADTAVSAITEATRVVQTVVPPRLPAYLGGAALLVLGVVDLPAAVGGALAYEAIRRWRPAPRR